jgi:Tol biopolymer transport system component
MIPSVIRKIWQYPSFPRIRQLTTNSSELPVRTAAISHDGKRLAFSDIKGLHIKNIVTGENSDIPFPQTTAGGRVDWQIMAWFPDGESFLANIAPFEDVCLHCEHFSAWVVPANGGVPQKVRDDANAESISPDGSQIAFTADLGMPGGHEVWLTDSKGNNPAKVYETNSNDWVRYVKWSPDGRRLSYIRSNDKQELLESRELGVAAPTTILSASAAHGIHDYVWTSDGRIVYGTDAGSSYAHDCNYWEISVNSRTGKPTSTPKRVTNWAGFVMDWSSISSDAKHLAFVESVDRSSINLMDVGPSGSLRGSARKLTLSESWNLPLGWTPDSRTLVFASSRDGIWGIYKQNVNYDSPTSLFIGLPDSPLAGAVTPDGKWVVYLQRRVGSNPQIMRLDLTGGRPETLDMHEEVLGIGCSRVQFPRCVVIGPGTDRGELVFFSFSPINGRTDELVRFSLPTNREDWEWQLSPDGSQVALLVPSEGRIHLISLESHERTEIPLNNFSSAYHLAWAADGKSLLLSNATRQGAALIRIDFRGTAQTLFEQRGDLTVLGLPSPDGRFLAVTNWTIASNVWMLENF